MQMCRLWPRVVKQCSTRKLDHDTSNDLYFPLSSKKGMARARNVLSVCALLFTLVVFQTLVSPVSLLYLHNFNKALPLCFDAEDKSGKPWWWVWCPSFVVTGTWRRRTFSTSIQTEEKWYVQWSFSLFQHTISTAPAFLDCVVYILYSYTVHKYLGHSPSLT